MATAIRIRRDTTTGWNTANPILANGELGLDTTSGEFKIGNGSNAWSTLPWRTDAVHVGVHPPRCHYRIWADSNIAVNMQNAINAIAAANTGYGVIEVFGRGTWDREVIIPTSYSGTIEIIGHGARFDKSPNSVFKMLAAFDAWNANLRISGCWFYGDWETNKSEVDNDDWATIHLDGFGSVHLRDCRFWYCRRTGALLTNCKQVRINNCELFGVTRDGFYLQNSDDVVVTGCRAFYVRDDAISCHIPSVNSTSDSQRSSWRRSVSISDNLIFASHGIKVLGGEHVQINNNRVIMPIGYGIYIGYDGSYGEGGWTQNTVMVNHNTVENVLDAVSLYTMGDIQTYIMVELYGKQASGMMISHNILRTNTVAAGTKLSGLYPTIADPRGLFDKTRFWNPDIILGTQRGIRILASNATDTNAIQCLNNMFIGSFQTGTTPLRTNT